GSVGEPGELRLGLAVARSEVDRAPVGGPRLVGPPELREHPTEVDVRAGIVRPETDGLVRRGERLFEVAFPRLERAQVDVEVEVAWTELACTLVVAPGGDEVPARHVLLAGVHPGAGVVRALLHRVVPDAERVPPLPGAVAVHGQRGGAEEERGGGERRAAAPPGSGRPAIEPP